jgi:hypothetical protein
MSKASVEKIEDEGKLLALIIKENYKPTGLEFLTAPDTNQQIGAMNHPAGHIIKRHVHKPIERKIIGTPEVLMVKSGAIELDIYNSERKLIKTVVLEKGDIVFLNNGGHGLMAIEDATIFEIKQGPYIEGEDKEYF